MPAEFEQNITPCEGCGDRDGDGKGSGDAVVEPCTRHGHTRRSKLLGYAVHEVEENADT